MKNPKDIMLHTITLLFIALLSIMDSSFAMSASPHCTALESEIKEQIHKANYCVTDKDCTRISAQCPFGCGDYINVVERNSLEKLTKKYQIDCGACFYDCYDPERFTLICDTGKCKAKR